MFRSRKLLAIALTLVILLAMLVPAAMAEPAAPEWVHGGWINSPTTADPAYVNPDEHRADFDIEYTISIVGLQVDNVWVKFSLIDQMNDVIRTQREVILAQDFETGDNVFTEEFAFSGHGHDVVILDGRERARDGWYDLKMCVGDVDPDREVFCDTQPKALLLDSEAPSVELEKPGEEEHGWGQGWDSHGATFVTGQAYLLVGTATDEWGIDEVEFQYCDVSNWPGCRWLESPSWIEIADGIPTPGVPDQWEALWNSAEVPDDFGMIRICAWDFVGNTNCESNRHHGGNEFTWTDDDQNPWADAHKVWVENRYELELQPGWNLISSPLVPYDTNINAVLAHLVFHGTVKTVVSYAADTTLWTMWTPSGPSSLGTLEDGKGYWIEMAAEDELTIVGTWKSVGPVSPPEYPVYTGWNLIGYTNWGEPPLWFMAPKFAMEYLGAAVHPYVSALWRYDAENEGYVQTLFLDDMTRGAGYWLATIQGGTIYP